MGTEIIYICSCDFLPKFVILIRPNLSTFVSLENHAPKPIKIPEEPRQPNLMLG